MEVLDKLKMMIREQDSPFFTDDELNFYLGENQGNLKATAYQCLLLKSESTSLSISGLSLEDTSKYFKRLAYHYRPNHSGILRG